MNYSTRMLAAVGASIVLLCGASPAAVAGDPGTASAPATASRSSVHAPAGWSARSDAAAARFGIPTSPARTALERVINPDDYACGPTDFDTYISQLINQMSDQEYFFLLDNLEMLDIPTYDALLSGTTGDSRYALRADYRQSLSKTFTDVKKFWDIQSGDIQLLAMHGSMLTDAARDARILEVIFGYSHAAAVSKAQGIASFIASGAFDNGNNPLFTLNAFAFTAEGDPDPLAAGLPDKLIFGDGILDALIALGIGDVGPRAVMGHEFGHHVQFEDNLFETTLSGAEATRRTELMADAFGTYFATHARGLALNVKRVLQAEKTFYIVGDCAFDNPGHHGTPNQRLRSSVWAADLAQGARPQGSILPSLTLAGLFEQELPEIVAPDAP